MELIQERCVNQETWRAHRRNRPISKHGTCGDKTQLKSKICNLHKRELRMKLTGIKHFLQPRKSQKVPITSTSDIYMKSAVSKNTAIRRIFLKTPRSFTSIFHYNISMFILLISVVHLTYSSKAIFGQLVVGEETNCTNEGQIVEVDLIKNNPCFRCMCRNMRVQCQFHCDEEPQCALPIKTEGNCCPVCKKCTRKLKQHDTTENWIQGEKNPCERFFCRDGILTRSKLQCHVHCKNPLPPSPGQCCPSCQGCEFENKTYEEGSTFSLPPPNLCTKCTCANGTINCSREPCPVLACKREEREMREDSCCLECVGHRAVSELDSGECRSSEGIIKNNEVKVLDECTRCRCKNGTLICGRKTCPISLKCPMMEWVYRPGECCPLCSADVPKKCSDARGRARKHGATWSEGRDSCRICSCVNASVTCEVNRCESQPTECPEGTMLEKVPGKCCKMCVKEPGMCSVFGDPHYRTFDGRPFNYQGDCKYIIAKDCQSMNFSIVVQNDAKTSRSFAWTKSVHLTIMGTGKNKEITVSLHQRLLTKVNGHKVFLPYISRTVVITLERYIVKVRTKTGVSLNWDGDSFLEIGASDAYKGLLCGLCGNYNGFSRDDFIGGDGLFKLDEISFAESWKVGGKDQCTRIDYSKGPKEPCDRSLAVKLAARKKCLIFKSLEFRVCYSKVNPVDYYKSCLTDTCECPPDHKCSCESILAYTSACTRKGVVIKWNRPMYCKKTCRRGKVYSQCGSACKRTCKNYKRLNARPCNKTCVAGCHCPAGYAIHQKKCIRFSECEKALRAARPRVIPRSSRRQKRTKYRVKRDVFHMYDNLKDFR